MVEESGYSFHGKRVFVTGAAGFIGSHLVRRLVNVGAEVHIYLKNNSSIFRINDVIKRLYLWHGDMTDYKSVCLSFREIRPDIVFHLAVFRNVERDSELIEPMFEINLRGTANLLMAIEEEKINLECFVNTGTCEEYGDGPVPFEEAQRESPVSPYSASKVAATYLCQMFFKTKGLPVVTLRPFLTYGSYQSPDMFVPSVICSCIRGENFSMTQGDQTREFNYIDDIIDAYILVPGRKNVIGEIINIGNGVEYRVKEIGEKIIRMMGSKNQLFVGSLPKRPGEARNFFCSNEKAKRLLGWNPKTSLDEGLTKTIEWYRKFGVSVANIC
jgi:nucleoside-diphosphate-sugar epimerase